jgi:hypothetical protein
MLDCHVCVCVRDVGMQLERLKNLIGYTNVRKSRGLACSAHFGALERNSMCHYSKRTVYTRSMILFCVMKINFCQLCDQIFGCDSTSKREIAYIIC